MMKKAKGPQFLRFFLPIIDVLKELDGSGTASEVTDLVIEELHISDAELEQTLKNGTSRIRNQVAWARAYLVKSGFVDSSRRGIWSLTEKGFKAELQDTDVLTYFKDVQQHMRAQSTSTENDTEGILGHDEPEEEALESKVVDYRAALLQLLKSLPPNGFERICQRLLRESGFQQVVVTGKSGDGGIDGHGILQVNPFVSFNVLFQCKRYQGAVSASHVRDFRGAMMGRADKGIILTTGSFTLDAKKEARRDGVPPIELVDGEKLIEMFELLELGLIPRKVFDIDQEFFDDFKEQI
jgi:restriction system protein